MYYLILFDIILFLKLFVKQKKKTKNKIIVDNNVYVRNGRMCCISATACNVLLQLYNNVACYSVMP